MLHLRPFVRGDLPALLAIQHACAGAGPPWSAATLEAQVCNPGHDGGRNVIVAERGGAVVGGAGWIAAGHEFFGAPVLAHDGAVATALVDDLVARARAAGAAWLRIGCSDGAPHLRAALCARGFAVRLHFATLTCTAAPRVLAPPAGLVRVPLAAADPAVVRDLDAETFAGIDNAGVMSLDEVRHLQARAWPDASGVWMDGARAAAFLVLLRDRDRVDHVLIDGVGVAAPWRRRGIARALVDLAIDAAARAGAAEVRAMIASTNAPSLALHAAAGLREAWRREMFQYDLERP